ncbi:hypothetical protein MFIFM68171_09821 [Madurella fahalii]|uniref:Uncharacterized protein n=1 Tax=Madurella fahalii TaxID=1157608 RepID=A0ABQ0GPE1_9PEZI
MDTPQAIANMARSSLGSPRITAKIDKVKTKIVQLPALTLAKDEFAHVVYVRLTPPEKQMLEAAVAASIGGDVDNIAELAETDGGEPDKLRDQVAGLLFLRWSFANFAIQNIFDRLHYIDLFQDVPVEDLKLFADQQSTRHDEFLPWDCRRQRTAELLADPLNQKFWYDFQHQPVSMAEASEAARLGVLPAPEDLKTWRLLALLVTKKHHIFRKWPGVHEAAAFAAGTGNTDPEYPYYDTWWQDFLDARAQAQAQELARRGDNSGDFMFPNPDGTIPRAVDVEPLIELLKALRIWPAHEQYEADWVLGIYGWFDCADVWDVWTLVRMLKLESATQEQGDVSDKSSGFPYAPLLEKGYRNPARKAPLPLVDPKELVELARYNTSKYTFHPIEDEDIVKQMVESVGLEDDGNWDLVCLEGTKRDIRPLFWAVDHPHFWHVLYVTEDVNWRYFTANREFPGQSLPCDCFDCEWMRKPAEDAPMEEKKTWERWLNHDHQQHDIHYADTHRGGETVFARRKLQDTAFAGNLDRFWIDWNDCMLIMGRAEKSGQITDSDTIYILETLPGIKARILKTACVDRDDEPSGLASACLFFNLKLENQDFLKTNRSLLRYTMNEKYQPHFSDFTYLIEPSEFDFKKAIFFGHGTYGSTYMVPWKRARQYDSAGDISYVEGSAVIKIVANSWKESVADREDLFTRKLEGFYNSIAGNRVKNTVAFYGYTYVTAWFYDDGHQGSKPFLSAPIVGRDVEVGREQVRAFVFEYATEGCLLLKIPELAATYFSSLPVHVIWFVLFRFFLDLGSAIQGINTIAPHKSIHPFNVLLRTNPILPPASTFNIPNIADPLPEEFTIEERYGVLLSEPSDVQSFRFAPSFYMFYDYLAPEIKHGYGASREHTASSNAYAFARFVLDVILAAKDEFDPLAAMNRVFHVEVLGWLEAMLSWEVGHGGAGNMDDNSGDTEDDDEDNMEDDGGECECECDDGEVEYEGEGEYDGNADDEQDDGAEDENDDDENDEEDDDDIRSIYGLRNFRDAGRVKAFEEFLKLMRDVATLQVALHTAYLVPYSSRLYKLEESFPHVWSMLHERMPHFDQHGVDLYWIRCDNKAEEGAQDWDDSDGGDDDSSQEESDVDRVFDNSSSSETSLSSQSDSD